MQLITTSILEKNRDVYVRTVELATYGALQVNSRSAKSKNQLQLNLMRAT